MIPEFQDDGYLPAGIFLAAFEEIAERFGHESEIRRVQTESLRWLIDVAKRAGVKRLIVNGSFVTDVVSPNDVDCVCLIDKEFPRETDAESVLLEGLPFLDIELVTKEAFDLLVETIFATDREQHPKGMIEVEL